MFDGEIDTDHIMAMCAHTPVPRIFIINQILSIQIYDAFVTTRKGIDIQIDGMYYAVLASQSEAADMIYKCLPEQFKKLPAVISYRAHYWMLEGDYQKAMKLYLSFAPDTEVEKGKTWAAMNIANFDKFIDNDVEAENFTTERSAERRRLAYLIVQLLTTERYLSKGNHGVKQTYPGIRRKVFYGYVCFYYLLSVK